MAGNRGRLALSYALLAPPVAWSSFEIGLAAVLRQSCGTAGWLGPAWGGGAILACLLAVVSGWWATEVRQGPPEAAGRWMGGIAALGAGIFALAILYQTLATLIVPPCAR